MTPGALKGLGIGCFLVCAVLLFVAWERYEDNASKVRAMNEMTRSSPLGQMMTAVTGGQELEPSMPAATKYALAGAVATAIGGVVSLVAAGNQGKRQRQQQRADVSGPRFDG